MDGHGTLPAAWSQRIDAASERFERLLDEQRYDEFSADLAQAAIASLTEGDPRVLDDTLAAWNRQLGTGDSEETPLLPQDPLVAAAIDLLPELTVQTMLPYLETES